MTDAEKTAAPGRPVPPPAALAALMGALAAGGIRVRIEPPRDRCVRCGEAIPPGRAGRACRECRGA